MREKRERVRVLLLTYHLTYAWLIFELEKRGVKVTSTELCDICHGRRTSEKAVNVIDTSMEILERYGTCYAGN